MTPKPLLVLLLCALLVTPAIAADYDVTGATLFVTDWGDQQKTFFNSVTSITYDASTQGEAINLVHFKVPSGSYVNFTLYYGTGATMTGSAQNNVVTWIPPTTTSYVTLNGVTKSYTYWDTNPEYDYNLAGYARERNTNQSGFIAYQAGYGSFDNNLAVFVPVSNIGSNLIYKVVMTSPHSFDADISHASYTAVSSAATKSILDQAADIVDFAFKMGSTILSVGTSLLYWLKFFFIDNLGLTVALYISGSLAFAARSCRGNPIRLLRTFFKDQKALFEFIITLWEKLVNIISSFRGIFRI